MQTYSRIISILMELQSSKLSIWPIQMIINELEPKVRLSTPLLGALWFGKTEPRMQLFLSQFTKEATKLEAGFTCDTKLFKMYALHCCVDSVARPMVLNSTQYNGFYGCSWCLYPGVTVDRQVKYPIQEVYEDRDHNGVLEDGNAAEETRQKVNGMKGKTHLADLSYFNLVWGIPPDYMHGVLLGVVKQLWNTRNRYHHPPNTNEFYIGIPLKKKIINRRLLSIRPPSEIYRLPRSLVEKSKWKAMEWRSWLLFYSVPVLDGILPEKYLAHWASLAESMYVLLKDKVTQEELYDAHNKLLHFVGNAQTLYGQRIMTYNMHMLTHLVPSVIKSGPLWATSCFPFESGLYHLKKMIRGPKGIEKQIVDKITKLSNLRCSIYNVNIKEEVQLFCSKMIRTYIPPINGQIRYLGSGFEADETAKNFLMMKIYYVFIVWK